MLLHQHFLYGASLFFLLSSTALAEHKPLVCAGYRHIVHEDPEKEFGTISSDLCPENHVIMGVNPPRVSRYAKPKEVFIQATCCPLPSDDILTSEHAFHFDECPIGFVATGSRENCPEGQVYPNIKGCTYEIRCTKINQKRYKLSDKHQGVHWGVGSSYWKQERHVAKREIPIALRYALNRKTKYSWRMQGCVGYPFGGILVRKEGKRCHSLYYRQLQYRGIDNDPEEGTLVQVFPECESLDSIFVKNPVCR